MIKKAVLFLMAVLLLLFAFGCSSAAKKAGNTPVAAPSQSPSQSPAAAQSITVFLQDMLDWKSQYWGKIESTYKETELASYFNNLNAPDYIITILPMYDLLSINAPGSDKVEGKLMVSGIPAYMDKKGNTIDFGFSYTYEEDAYLYPKGSQEKASGKFDILSNTLQYEDTVTSGTQVLSHTILEIRKNTDGSYLSQYFYAQSQKPVAGVWSTLRKDAYAVCSGSKLGDTDFSYTSILDGKTTLEAAQRGFKIEAKASANPNGASMQ